MLGIFGWARKAMKDALLAGAQDALKALANVQVKQQEEAIDAEFQLIYRPTEASEPVEEAETTAKRRGRKSAEAA